MRSCMCSRRSMWASTTWREVVSPVRIARARSVADRSVSGWAGARTAIAQNLQGAGGSGRRRTDRRRQPGRAGAACTLTFMPGSQSPPAALDGPPPEGADGCEQGTLDRFAELIVRFAANVQPGQIVAISTEPGKLELTRAVAERAYRAGAKFVDVMQFDVHVKRSRILHAAEDTLDYVPPWYGERVLALGEHRAARVALTGPSMPGLLSDLDPARAGRDQLPFLRESAQVVNARTTNWTAVPCPTQPWAQLVHPDLEPAEALARL